MSLQVFLQAQMLGSEDFLSRQPCEAHEPAADLMGRSAWLTLLCEVLPRALLAELKLSRMLLGSSSAEQFLLVLAEEDIQRANEFLSRAAEYLQQLSDNTLRLVWASTENLGSWPVARKRLDDALQAKISSPLTSSDDAVSAFTPFADSGARSASYFENFGTGLAGASRVHWSSEHPAALDWNSGQYSWPLLEQSRVEEDGILFPRRFAMSEDGVTPSSVAEIANRAEGSPRWAILRGDVDHFDQQLRRAGSIEDHIHLSVLLQEFFAGELAVLCAMPDFWRRVTVLYRGGDDFAVIGSWDALLLLARELQRLFEKFVAEHLSVLPGVEAKTVSMALAIAPEIDSPPAAVFQSAGAALRAAKATEVGSFNLFGRTLEWKRLAEAEELKNGLLRLAREFGFSPSYINDLASVYREAFSAGAGRRSKAVRVDRPWRTYLRLSRVMPQARGKEFLNLRNAVITNLLGTRSAGIKLRPSARVGLEWARLAASD